MAIAACALLVIGGAYFGRKYINEVKKRKSNQMNAEAAVPKKELEMVVALGVGA